MQRWVRAFGLLGLGLAVAGPALPDQEAGNVSHLAAGPYGRCYAKSVPDDVHDPDDGSRQRGTTIVYRVADGDDVRVHVYDWFSQRLFVRCGAGDDVMLVRIGPWQRGHDPRSDHLALAFYRRGALLRRYSTLDIAGSEPAADGGISRYRNVSASVSHYTVFASGPEMVREVSWDGPIFTENWWITATTIDGRTLRFDMETGQIR